MSTAAVSVSTTKSSQVTTYSVQHSVQRRVAGMMHRKNNVLRSPVFTGSQRSTHRDFPRTHLAPWTREHEVGVDVLLAELLRDVETQRPVSVVDSPLRCVRQHRVRVVDFFELQNKNTIQCGHAPGLSKTNILKVSVLSLERTAILLFPWHQGCPDSCLDETSMPTETRQCTIISTEPATCFRELIVKAVNGIAVVNMCRSNADKTSPFDKLS